jgi:hypothetical protein
MRDYQGLTHTTWDSKYHVVFIPKRRKKALFGAIRKRLGRGLHELAEQKGCQIVEGHLQADHVHMCISIPPKHSVSCSGIHQGQECDIDREEVYREDEKLHGRELLGRWLFCIDGGVR